MSPREQRGVCEKSAEAFGRKKGKVKKSIEEINLIMS
jgi:hypothetical protein